jgi:hypothetical protein
MEKRRRRIRQRSWPATQTGTFISPAKQLQNTGGVQEDSDCLLALEWEKLFHDRVAELIKKL